MLPSTTVQVTTTVLLPTTTSDAPDGHDHPGCVRFCSTTTAPAPVVMAATTVPSEQDRTGRTIEHRGRNTPTRRSRSDMERIADSLREDGGVPSGSTVVLAGGASLLLLAGTVLASSPPPSPASKEYDELRTRLEQDAQELAAAKAAVAKALSEFHANKPPLWDEISRNLRGLDALTVRHMKSQEWDKLTRNALQLSSYAALAASILTLYKMTPGTTSYISRRKRTMKAIGVLGGLIRRLRPWQHGSGLAPDRRPCSWTRCEAARRPLRCTCERGVNSTTQPS